MGDWGAAKERVMRAVSILRLLFMFMPVGWMGGGHLIDVWTTLVAGNRLIKMIQV